MVGEKFGVFSSEFGEELDSLFRGNDKGGGNDKREAGFEI